MGLGSNSGSNTNSEPFAESLKLCQPKFLLLLNECKVIDLIQLLGEYQYINADTSKMELMMRC